MTHLILARHGRTASNVAHVLNSPAESIDEVGFAQAQTLRGRIEAADVRYDRIVSSPLPRARQTAAIANWMGLPIDCDDRLRERDPGDLAGVHLEPDLRARYWNYANRAEDFSDSETIDALFARVAAFLDDVRHGRARRVLAITHSGVSIAVHCLLEGVPSDGDLRFLGLENGDVWQLEP